MLEKKKHRHPYYMRQRFLLEIGDETDLSEILDKLFGKDEYDNPEYVVYKYEDSTSRTFIQRFNALWVWPLFILSMPFQWLFKGQVGLNRHSKLGRLVDYLVGFDQ